MKKLLFISVFISCVFCGCDSQPGNTAKETLGSEIKKQGTPSTATESLKTIAYKEGEDYTIYERVRLMDRVGFTEPQEAYSVLLPKGWQHQGDIIWNQPRTSCAGTFKKLKAQSADGQFEFEMLPDLVYTWNTNTELMQFNQSNNSSSYCETREPIEAESYLKNIFSAEIGNPEIIQIETNAGVVNEMQQQNATVINEMQQYGAGSMNFNQTAINARVRWNDGREGLITLGVSILEGSVPNIYNGSSSMIYTTLITKRTVFKYPAKQSELAKNLYSVIMPSFRSNPAWNDAVNRFWKDARQQSHTVHIGRIKMMDEQTRRIGEQTIRSGQERLNNMDAQMRSWEQQQSSQDRMHTEFIKTIREVENYRDETGKYEMTSGYGHAWSRGDGSSFILSDNPNFDPASVFQDQSWKEMQKVR